MDPIEAAIEALKSGEFPSIQAAATAHGVNRCTLSRRYRGVTRSQAQYHDDQRFLPEGGEQELVNYILKLSTHGIPPTIAMIRRFATEIGGKEPGKNWTYRFCKRHEEKLKSGYLDGFDLVRKHADNPTQVKWYFDLVCAAYS